MKLWVIFGNPISSESQGNFCLLAVDDGGDGGDQNDVTGPYDLNTMETMVDMTSAKIVGTMIFISAVTRNAVNIVVFRPPI